MRYLLAIILPPVAVFICGKPVQFFLNLVLTLLFYFPGMIHAVFVVSNYYADKRTDRIVTAVKSSSGITEEIPQSKKKSPWVWIVLGIVLIMAILSLFDKSDNKTPSSVYTSPVREVSVKKAPSPEIKQTKPADVPIETEEQKKVREMKIEMAVSSMKMHDEVQDASVVQEGQTFSLALIVQNNVTSEKAKELGESFVRQVISLCEEGSLGKDIGKSKFNYLIGVYHFDKTEIVSGAKAASSLRITW